MMYRHRPAGFTLVEVLLVVIIIAILAAIVMPVFSSFNRNTRYQTCTENLKEIGAALAMYRSEHDAYPAAPNPIYLSDMQPVDIPFDQKPATPALLTSLNNNWREWAPVNALDPYADYAQQAVTSLDDLSTGNFGLATLYALYLADTNNYLTSYQTYHCPAQLSTARVQRNAGIESLQTMNSEDPRNFDPLWAGYNTYDRNYNYDQFTNDLTAYDAAIMPATAGEALRHINFKRQLRFADAPADTVVTWCDQHMTAGPDDLGVVVRREITAVDAATARSAEKARAREVRLVLWLDGGVAPARPQLQKSLADGYYYWVPTFLYGRGESQQ